MRIRGCFQNGNNHRYDKRNNFKSVFSGICETKQVNNERMEHCLLADYLHGLVTTIAEPNKQY